MSFFKRRLTRGDPRDTRIRELEAENTGLTQAADALHESYKREHERLQARNAELVKRNNLLRSGVENLQKTLIATLADLGRARDDERATRRQLADALTEVRRLDGENVVLAGEVLELQGRLADAEEQLAAFKAGVA